MPISLKEMMKKAEEKGYGKDTTPIKKQEATKPWQKNSLHLTSNIEEGLVQETANENHTQTTHEITHNHTRNRTQNYNHTQITHETAHKPNTNAHTKPYTKPHTINRIKGIQKQLLTYLYLECKKNRNLISPLLSKDEISKKLGVNIRSLHNSIQRLVQKAMLIRKEVMVGRSGATAYELPESVYDDMSQNEILFMSDAQSEPYTKSNTNTYTNTYTKSNTNSVYSNNINNITTNKTNLPEDWLEINISPLEEINFSITQLKQIYEASPLDAETVQDSIYQFAFSLTHNKKAVENYSDPLRLIVGTLRKGNTWNEAKYKSPQIIAQEQLLKAKKTEREHIKKLNDEAYALAFDEWKEELTQKQIEEIVPAKRGKGDIMPQNVKLSNYFKENIWPEKKFEYIAG